MTTSKYYVGSKGTHMEIFRFAKTPTASTHGDRFASVTGPFRTKGGAQAMVDGGYGNPHTLTVSQCERIALRTRERRRSK